MPSRVTNLEATIDQLAKIVEVQPRDRKRFKRLLDESKRLESVPLRTRLTDEEVARFAVNQYRFPGVDIKARLFRQYPFGEIASQLIGYVSRINDRDLERIDEWNETANYKGSDYIGKVGVELVVRARAARRHRRRGSRGRFRRPRAVRTLSRTPPVSGNNLRLCTGHPAAENRRGGVRRPARALVAIDPATGEILAFVSEPGFDPNLFVDGIDPSSWEQLNDSPDKPLLNRPLRGAYPPGSTIKPYPGARPR